MTYTAESVPLSRSALDIIGQDIANSIGTVLLESMLFDHVGEDETATALRNAVTKQLATSNIPRTSRL